MNKKHLFNTCILTGALLSAGSAVATEKNYALNFASKVGHGIVNATTGFLELPKNIVNVSREQNVLVGLTWGTTRGIMQSICRSAAGGMEIATAPFPTDHYVDPNLVWQRFDEDTSCLDFDRTIPTNYTGIGMSHPQAAPHLCEMEKALHNWLVVPNKSVDASGTGQEVQHAAAYFETASDIPYRTDQQAIEELGKYLAAYPAAAAEVIAYTDTVDTVEYNQDLSYRRAETVKRMLVAQGARPEQVRTKAMGQAGGPENYENQQNRVAMMSVIRPIANPDVCDKYK